MGRHEQREQVFKLLFRVEFHSPEDMPEQLALFRENNEEVPSWQDADAIAARFEKIKDKIPELDKLLNENTEGWDTTRVGKVELAVLRLGAYELRYDDDANLDLSFKITKETVLDAWHTLVGDHDAVYKAREVNRQNNYL